MFDILKLRQLRMTYISLVYTAILVYTALVSEKSKELIVEYIKECNGKATKNKVVDYMAKLSGNNEGFRTSRVTTFDLIDELVESKRIKIIKPKAWRAGQALYLIANDDNNYRWLEKEIENIDIYLHEHPETKERMINPLIINLQMANELIKNEIDRQELIQRIVNQLLKIRIVSKSLKIRYDIKND